MDTRKQEVSTLEEKMSASFNTQVRQSLSEAETLRKEYERIAKTCGDVSDQVKGFFDEFEAKRAEMDTLSKNCKDIQTEIETTYAECLTLNTQITNIQTAVEKRNKA